MDDDEKIYYKQYGVKPKLPKKDKRIFSYKKLILKKRILMGKLKRGEKVDPKEIEECDKNLKELEDEIYFG